MILCPLSEFRRYRSLHPTFAAVDDYLRTTDLRRLPEGRTDPDGSGFHVSCAPEARTRPAAEAPLEAHRAFIDVQVVLDGTDTMGWAPLEACSEAVAPYDPDGDIIFFRDRPRSWVRVEAEQVAVFFPEDAHAPLVGGGETVHKLVVKVKVLAA